MEDLLYIRNSKVQDGPLASTRPMALEFVFSVIL